MTYSLISLKSQEAVGERQPSGTVLKRISKCAKYTSCVQIMMPFLFLGRSGLLHSGHTVLSNQLYYYTVQILRQDQS